MPLSGVLVSGIDLIIVILVLLLLSGLFIGVGINVFEGELELGIIFILLGALVLMAGLAGMTTKIIADGVSWGVHANSDQVTNSKSGNSSSNLPEGKPPTQTVSKSEEEE